MLVIVELRLLVDENLVVEHILLVDQSVHTLVHLVKCLFVGGTNLFLRVN